MRYNFININQMKSHDLGEMSSEIECIFCDEYDETSDLYEMMNQALFAKHCNQNNNHYTNPIDIILKLQEPVTPPQFADFAKYKENVFMDQRQENMKRTYDQHQFNGKIKMLSEYYKFHKDIPRVIESSIEKILGKYYDRKRQFDYKCIKKLLKQQQGLSITSIQQSMSENSQDVELKSKYSTVLNGLEDTDENNHHKHQKMSDSNILVQICKQIGKALPKTKISDNDFKGIFFRSEKNFQDYVKSQKHANKKQSIFNKKPNKKIDLPSNYFGFKKGNIKSDNETTARIKRQSKLPPKYQERSDESKKKFVYNTNIKIQIQNAMFYPDTSSPGNYELVEGQKNSLYNSGIRGKTKKSLIGKISTINNERYRTPVSKIYQPQEVEASKFRKKGNISQSKERLRTKERQTRDYLPEREQRKIISSNSVRKFSLDKQKLQNQGTISVGKLKIQNKKISGGPSRSASIQSIRRRSVTLAQNNRQSSADKIPITKYSSSEMKNNKGMKGININELLTKKLNIYER